MNADIEFLHDFILYDREHLEDLYEPLFFALQQIGDRLRRKCSDIIIIYESEDDPMYELIQLLDGNNFKIEYGQNVMGYPAVKAIPIYPETLTITYEPEIELQIWFTESATKYVSYVPEVRNPPRRGLRAKVPLIDDCSFNEKLFDEFLKPP